MYEVPNLQHYGPGFNNFERFSIFGLEYYELLTLFPDVYNDTYQNAHDDAFVWQLGVILILLFWLNFTICTYDISANWLIILS